MDKKIHEESAADGPDIDDTVIAPQPGLPQGDENILFVDADVDRRNRLTETLRALGFNVSPVSNGRWGFSAMLAENADLLLAAASMPDFSGVELADVALKLRPGMPILLLLDDDPQSCARARHLQRDLHTAPAGSDIMEIARLVRRALDDG